jgi:hypothetical protein
MKKFFIILFAIAFLYSCETAQEKERRTGHEWMHIVSEVHDTHNPDCKYCKERIHNEIIETVDSILKSRGL